MKQEGSLVHGKTWLGRRFCRLVIYANLHIFPYVCASFFKLLLWLLELQFKRRKFGTWQNMAWKTFLLFGYSCLPYMCIKMAPTVLFLTFLANVWFQVGKKHLEHGKPCFGRCFCCLVIYLNLHGCPVCASKSFQRGICFFSDVIRTWQHMVWKAFLLFCDLCQSSQVSMYSNGSGGTFFFTFLWLLGFKSKKGSLEHGKTWLGRRSCCVVIPANSMWFMSIFTSCHVFYMHQNGSAGISAGTFFSLSCGCWDLSRKKEA